MDEQRPPAPVPPPPPQPIVRLRLWAAQVLAAAQALAQNTSDAFRVGFTSGRPGSRRRHRRRRPLVHAFSMRVLLVVPVFLAVATAVVLFTYSDVNVAMLYSQCSARARLPALTQRLPALLGTPACFLVSFMQEALGEVARTSTRAVAIMGAVLAFVAGLLTVSTVEAARLCNGPSLLIAYPTGAWLAFDLIGGAVVWELVILPAFFRRSKQIVVEEEAEAEAEGAENVEEVEAPSAGPSDGRRLAVVAEVVAIPAAVAVGYVLPSVVMLFTDAPAAIAVWFFFPAFVAVLRRAIRAAVVRVGGAAGRRLPNRGFLQRLAAPLHLESHRPSLVAMYALPVACSAAAHGFLLWHLVARADDRRELTRSTLRVVEIDAFFVGLTVLYWVLVEAGAGVVLRTVAWSVLLGPGGGLCLGWIHRERQLGLAGGEAAHGADGGDDMEAGGRGADEETPLLR